MAKKIVTVGVRMDEEMFKRLKGMAEADGMTESSLARLLIGNYLEERAAYYARLHSIFGGAQGAGNRNDEQPRSASCALSDLDDIEEGQ